MGCCSSCCGDGSDGDNVKEMELQAQQAKSLSISAKMSAPTIKISSGQIAGSGLALAGVPIEQDAAYWEWHISLPAKTHVDTILFGVSSRKDRKFYEGLSDNTEEGESSADLGTQWMRKIEVQNGDVVGVAVQQSDLPMLQFLLNGEALHESAVNRFRGAVYPSIALPASSPDELKVTLVLEEAKFQQESPSPRFGPVIVARSIV